MCSRPTDRLHVGVRRLPGPRRNSNSTRCWLPRHHEPGATLPQQRPPPVFWQFFFFGQASTGSGETEDILLFHYPPQQTGMACRTQRCESQEDEAWGCSLSPGRQHGGDSVEGQTARGRSFHKLSGQDGEEGEEDPWWQEGGCHPRDCTCIQQEYGGGWILLTSMHLTTTLAVPQCAGGGTSVGGCSRPLWWMHSSFGRSVRGQHRPRKACVTWTFVWLFFAPCARATWAENWDQRKLWPRQV